MSSVNDRAMLGALDALWNPVSEREAEQLVKIKIELMIRLASKVEGTCGSRHFVRDIQGAFLEVLEEARPSISEFFGKYPRETRETLQRLDDLLGSDDFSLASGLFEVRVLRAFADIMRGQEER